jgi:hypothetical protein
MFGAVGFRGRMIEVMHLNPETICEYETLVDLRAVWQTVMATPREQHRSLSWYLVQVWGKKDEWLGPFSTLYEALASLATVTAHTSGTVSS